MFSLAPWILFCSHMRSFARHRPREFHAGWLGRKCIQVLRWLYVNENSFLYYKVNLFLFLKLISFSLLKIIGYKSLPSMHDVSFD